MARMTLEQAKNNNNYDSEWFKVNPNEMKVVQFFGNNEEDIDAFAVHTVDCDGFQYGRDVHCLREYGEPTEMCPLCQAGLQRKTALILSMVDVKTEKVCIWSRGVGRGNAFISNLQSIFNRNQPVNKKLFGIERFGEKLDTSYTIFRYEQDDLQPLDMTQFKKPDTEKAILKLTKQQMEEYVDTGKWTKEENTPQKEEQPRFKSRRG